MKPSNTGILSAARFNNDAPSASLIQRLLVATVMASWNPLNRSARAYQPGEFGGSRPGHIRSTARNSSVTTSVKIIGNVSSIEQRLRRWLKNSKIDVRAWYEPFVRSTLRTYAPGVTYVVMDSTQYGPGCRALVIGVAYGGQVLPLGWRWAPSAPSL